MSDNSEQEPISTDIVIRAPHKPEKCVPSCDDSLLSRGAQPVTLPPHVRKSLTLSPIYSALRSDTYLKQCFDNVKYLAEGSFGVVFEARSKDDGKLYAIKQFKKRFTSRKQRNLRLAEIHRYASLPQNQFCVELIRAWEEDAYLFVQMELCSVTLKQYMTRNQFVKEEMLWKILLDLLLAVQHLHSHQYVHLDIKPDNILVSSDNVFKLADFGLMLDLSKGPVKDADEGDSRYLAPEVLRGVFTKAADIFSLGISMLEVGSSIQLPSCGCFWQELRCGVLPYCRFSSLSTELFELICTMMAPAPGDRPSADKLLKYKKLAKLHRSSCILAFLSEMAAAVKSFCALGKIMAVNCGLSVFKPIASRVCPITWKKDSRSVEAEPCFNKIRSHAQDSQGAPKQVIVPDAPVATRVRREAERRLFQARLAVCKKRLSFDDEDSDAADPDQVSSIIRNERLESYNYDGATKCLLSPKRRRLLE